MLITEFSVAGGDAYCDSPKCETIPLMDYAHSKPLMCTEMFSILMWRTAFLFIRCFELLSSLRNTGDKKQPHTCVIGDRTLKCDPSQTDVTTQLKTTGSKRSLMESARRHILGGDVTQHAACTALCIVVTSPPTQQEPSARK